jgi:hypothetical protein
MKSRKKSKIKKMTIATAATAKKMAAKGDVVVLSLKEYQNLLAKREESLSLTPFQKAALRRAEKELKMGKCLSLDEIRKKLGFKN